MIRSAVRHVITVGKRSLAVVIPKKWIYGIGLRKGDKIFLTLNRDGSITLYPVPKRFMKRSKRDRVNKCINVSIESLNDRIVLKEILSNLVFNGSSLCIDDINMVRDMMASLVGDYEKLVNHSLDFIEKGFDSLEKFLINMENIYAEKIHEIEFEMDMIYYLSFRRYIREFIKELYKELDTDHIARYAVYNILIKISEDVIDSIDRIIWRIYETKTYSEDIRDIIRSLKNISHEIISCIRYKCESNDLSERFKDLNILRARLRRDITRIPQSILPVVIEVEGLINNIESLLEIAIIKREISSQREEKKEM